MQNTGDGQTGTQSSGEGQTAASESPKVIGPGVH
jgi:hypothetical protein